MASPAFGPRLAICQIQPLLDLDAAALVPRIESAGLAAEILQDRAGLEDRDRPAARTVVIDDRRHAVVGRDRQEFRLELIAARDVDRDHGVGQPAFLEHDRDLEAVRRRPVVEVDRRLARGRASFVGRSAPGLGLCRNGLAGGGLRIGLGALRAMAMLLDATEQQGSALASPRARPRHRTPRRAQAFHKRFQILI